MAGIDSGSGSESGRYSVEILRLPKAVAGRHRGRPLQDTGFVGVALCGGPACNPQIASQTQTSQQSKWQKDHTGIKRRGGDGGRRLTAVFSVTATSAVTP